MQDDQTSPETADDLSSLSWAEYLERKTPDPTPPRRPSIIPRSRVYTAVMLAILLLLAIYGVASGNATGVIIAVVLVAFVFLPVGLVLFLERRNPPEPLAEEHGRSAEGSDTAAPGQEWPHS